MGEEKEEGEVGRGGNRRTREKEGGQREKERQRETDWISLRSQPLCSHCSHQVQTRGENA